MCEKLWKTNFEIIVVM